MKRAKRFVRSYCFSGMILLVVFLLHILMTVLCLTPKRYSLDENGAPTETIYAEYTSEDRVSTESARQAARNQIPTQYKYDPSQVLLYQQELSELFHDIDAFRERANQIRKDSQLVPGEDVRTWQEVIPEETLALMLPREIKGTVSDPSIGYALLDAASSCRRIVESVSTISVGLR